MIQRQVYHVRICIAALSELTGCVVHNTQLIACSPDGTVYVSRAETQ